MSTFGVLVVGTEHWDMMGEGQDWRSFRIIVPEVGGGGRLMWCSMNSQYYGIVTDEPEYPVSADLDRVHLVEVSLQRVLGRTHVTPRGVVDTILA